MKKLDWIFSNQYFLSTWPTTHSIFLPRDYSDHSSMILEFSTPEPRPPSPFKFLNFWADRSEFLDLYSPFRTAKPLAQMVSHQLSSNAV
jgi:hypothetical protein